MTATAKPKGGHPTADELTSRCAGTNRRGGQCGLPPVAGLAVCRQHIVSTPSAKLLSVPDKLRDLTAASLDRLAEVIAHGKDADAVRAAGLVLGVTLPKTVLVGPAPVDEDGTVSSPLDAIRARLEKIRNGTTLDDTPSAPTPPAPPARRELAPAPLSAGATEVPVRTPEPVGRADVPESAGTPVYGATAQLVPEPEIVDAVLVDDEPEDNPYGVPRIVSRPASIREEQLRRGLLHQ